MGRFAWWLPVNIRMAFFDKSSHNPEGVKLEPFRSQTTQERRVNARYYANIEGAR